MITANFRAYASYATDSLHQWDLNQVLEVRGLNLTTTPEVHFSNANTDRAIPRQATMNGAGVVTVGVPNSLLQEPLRIYAHIGIYEGDTFKVVELAEIPVIPRKRPQDYQIQDADEEIYSFNHLENQVQNCLDQLAAKEDKLVKCSACVVFSSAYKNAYGKDFIASSIVPLVNAEMYTGISLAGDVNIVGLSNKMGATRFTVSRYGTGFALFSEDELAVQTVAGKAVSFEFTLTK